MTRPTLGPNMGLALAGLLALAPVPGLAQPAMAPSLNDYPTEARAEYVFACMAANGQAQDILRRCACSVDVMASILPYRDYVAGETVLMMRQTSGERSALFRGAAATAAPVAALRRAQAEAEMLCF